MSAPSEKSPSPVLLSYAFRPFFLLTGLFAIGVIPIWIAVLHGAGLPGITSLWHAHEMLLGFAMSAVAGFSLTAVATWTGRPAIHGMPLALLVFCWLAGRLAMVLAAWLPASLVAILDMLFPLLFCFLLGREILAGTSKRNYILILIVCCFACLNGVYHLGINQLLAGGDRISVYLLIYALLVLVTIIAGRIIPAFTGNWLRSQGRNKLPVNSTGIDLITILLTVLMGPLAVFAPWHPITGALAFATAALHGYRLSRWRGFATLSNPLLFVLHASYAWLPLGYALLGCAAFGWLSSPTTALHALTMGAIANMILAATSRVALGHTGRPLQAARATVLAYCLLMLAALIRVLGPLIGGNGLLMIDLSAIGWVMAFTIFLWVYWPILTRARVA